MGAALLSLGLLMVWTALKPRVAVLRPALASVLLFAVLHFAYHAAAWRHMDAGDNIANLVVLSLVVVVPAALLWLDLTRRKERDELALEYQEALRDALSTVPEDLLARMRRQYDDAQLAELTRDIAFPTVR